MKYLSIFPSALKCAYTSTLLMMLMITGSALADDAGNLDLQAHVLGGEADPGLLTRDDEGQHTLSGRGREAYSGRDEGSFAGFETDASNFTFTARIVKGPEGTPNPKYGISIRGGLRGTEKAVNLRHDGYEQNRCIQWFMRYRVSPVDQEGGRQSFHDGLERDRTASEGFWMRIVRQYPFVQLYTSEDGQQWDRVAADYQIALLPQQVWVGLQVTAGGNGNQPIQVAYDNIQFTKDPAGERAGRFEDYKEYTPPQRVWQMTQVRIPGGKGEITPFLLMPKDMDPADIRGLIFSTGSKEIILAGNRPMEWDSGPGQLRKPKAMDDWEGVLDIDDLRPWNEIWAYHGFVRLGGAFPPASYEAAVEALAKATGIAHLPNIPFVVTGGSFAGGYSAQAARLHTDRALASAPVIIGMAGAETEDPDVLATPHLHIYGTRDGSHHPDVLRRAPEVRKRGALWASAPMWQVGHFPNRADSIYQPYFFEMARLRLPEDKPNYTAGRVELRRLREKDGWFGLIDTWETNFPTIVPVAEYKGDSENLVWLPNESLARVWQSFVSHNPRTVIHFPMDEGSNGFGGPSPHNWHRSFMAANEPWELVASGPAGEEVEVTYYSGLDPIGVVKTHRENPYRVTLEGLKPGLHVIHAIVRAGEKEEISRPVTILFTERQD